MSTPSVVKQAEDSVASKLQLTSRQADAPRGRPRLFCLPHVGGSAAVFDPWEEALGATVELRSVQLPGRGALLDQAPIRFFDVLVEQLVAALKPLLDRPWAIFGHSFGALVAYETSKQLYERYRSIPRVLLVAGPAPDMPATTPPVATLPDAEFFSALKEINGTPEAVLQNRAVMRRLLPSLRADFAMFEAYQPSPDNGTPPLDCPVAAFGGDRDPMVSFAHVLGWRRRTRGPFECRIFPGNHFFPFQDSGFIEVLTEYLHAFF